MHDRLSASDPIRSETRNREFASLSSLLAIPMKSMQGHKLSMQFMGKTQESSSVECVGAWCSASFSISSSYRGRLNGKLVNY